MKTASNPKSYGIFGGGSIRVLGSRHRMWSFFECARHVGKQSGIEGLDLVTDRLYARYIPLPALPAARVVMAALAQAFSKVQGSELALATAMFRLEVQGRSMESLESAFSDFFEAFTHCADCIEIKFDLFRDYPGYDYGAMRVVVSDIPEFFNYKDRSLKDLDEAVGDPIWLTDQSRSET